MSSRRTSTRATSARIELESSDRLRDAGCWVIDLLHRVTERVGRDVFVTKVTSATKELDTEQRARMMEQVDAARTALEVLHKKLSAKQ